MLINELKAGDKLKMSVVCARTGIVLLPAGTVLTQAHIDHLANRDVFLGSQQEIAREQERIKKIFNQVMSGSAPFGREKISEEAKREFEILKESAYDVYYDRKNWNKSKKAVHDLLNTENLSDLISISTAEKVETVEQNALNSSIQVASFMKNMDVSKEKKESLVIAAYLADIGLKEITDDNAIKNHDVDHKNHPQETLRVVKELEPNLVQPMTKAIMQHHETLDGLGVPHGIKDVDPSAQLIGACYKLNLTSAETNSASEILERFYALNEKYSPIILRVLFTSAFILPEKRKVTLDGKKAVIEQHNPENPDRPIVMVESDTDYRGYRYTDLTKDLTSFIDF